ncbi:MAG: AI-2E family transporter [Phyllobacteriaceae bacterium]|nr:AI-2E family transporter [Phyllobacteriaceae bacterium]
MARPDRFAALSPARPAVPPRAAEPRDARSAGRDRTGPATLGLFVLALLVALHAAAALVVPMTAAVILGSVLAHVGDRGQRIGVPPVVAAMALVVMTGTGLFLLGSAVAEAVGGLAERAPAMVERMDGLLDRLIAPFGAVGSALGGTGGLVGGPPPEGRLGRIASSVDMNAVTSFLGGLTPALGEVLIFLATLVFFVAGRASLRRRAILSFGDRDRRLAAIRVFNSAETALATFFGTTAVIYLGVGFVTALLAWSGGLPNPALWGVVTMLLSFVPFLGPAIVAFALASSGLLSHDGVVAALWPACGFLAVHLVCENMVIPSILGRKFEINPFLVFVAIVFWSWMWGAMGAVLAVPILLVARTLREELNDEPTGVLPD